MLKLQEMRMDRQRRGEEYRMVFKGSACNLDSLAHLATTKNNLNPAYPGVVNTSRTILPNRTIWGRKWCRCGIIPYCLAIMYGNFDFLFCRCTRLLLSHLILYELVLACSSL